MTFRTRRLAFAIMAALALTSATGCTLCNTPRDEDPPYGDVYLHVGVQVSNAPIGATVPPLPSHIECPASGSHSAIGTSVDVPQVLKIHTDDILTCTLSVVLEPEPHPPTISVECTQAYVFHFAEFSRHEIINESLDLATSGSPNGVGCSALSASAPGPGASLTLSTPSYIYPRNLRVDVTFHVDYAVGPAAPAELPTIPSSTTTTSKKSTTSSTTSTTRPQSGLPPKESPSSTSTTRPQIGLPPKKSPSSTSTSTTRSTIG